MRYQILRQFLKALTGAVWVIMILLTFCHVGEQYVCCCILVFHSFIYLVINFASLSLSLSASTVLWTIVSRYSHHQQCWNIFQKVCIHYQRASARKRARDAARWKKAYSTEYSQAVTHPSTNSALCCLTSVIRRELVFSTWYGRRQYCRQNTQLHRYSSQYIFTGT